jgi:hypothetical protein
MDLTLVELRKQFGATILALANDAQSPTPMPVVSAEAEKARNLGIQEATAKLVQVADLAGRGEGVDIHQQVEEQLTVLRERLHKRPSDGLFNEMAAAFVALDRHTRKAS